MEGDIVRYEKFCQVLLNFIHLTAYTALGHPTFIHLLAMRPAEAGRAKIDVMSSFSLWVLSMTRT